MGLDRPGRSLCLDEILRIPRQSRSNPQRDSRLRSGDSALGLQRQRTSLLGFYFRCQRPPASATTASLRLRTQFHSLSRPATPTTPPLLSPSPWFPIHHHRPPPPSRRN